MKPSAARRIPIGLLRNVCAHDCRKWSAGDPHQAIRRARPSSSSSIRAALVPVIPLVRKPGQMSSADSANHANPGIAWPSDLASNNIPEASVSSCAHWNNRTRWPSCPKTPRITWCVPPTSSTLVLCRRPLFLFWRMPHFRQTGSSQWAEIARNRT